MQAGKRQKSDGSDFGAHPSDHLRGLVSSLEEALDSSDIGADQGAETASILAQTAETCIGSGDAGTPPPLTKLGPLGAEFRPQLFGIYH